MKLAASNIGWTRAEDGYMLRRLRELGYTGLEIAATRVFPENPYEKLREAREFSRRLREEHGLQVCSLQSIWYGKGQRIAQSEENRLFLLDYTRRAAAFAREMGCGNLVFGCPRNRSLESPEEAPILEEFLWRCAEAAAEYEVVVAVEANPPIYHTNYLNTTSLALALVKKLEHPFLRLNLDLGTVIENGESLDWLETGLPLVHHVHVSEPMLLPLRPRAQREELLEKLRRLGYEGYVSAEMGNAAGAAAVEEALRGLAASAGKRA